MKRKFGIVAVLVALAASPAHAQPAQVPGRARTAEGPRRLMFSAVGTRFQFSQPVSIAYPSLPARTVHGYTATIDFDEPAIRVEQDLVTSPTTGYFVGDQHAVEIFAAGYAWGEQSAAAGQRASAPVMRAQPDTAVDRELWLWMSTPQGVLRAAAGGAARQVVGGTELGFRIGGRFPATAMLNDLKQVVWVRTTIANPVLGDTPVEVHFSGYRDYAGIQFPSLISQYQGGTPYIQLAVTAVRADREARIAVPDDIKAAKPAEAQVKSEKVEEGIYRIFGMIHHSMAVDMGDYSVVVEAPLDEARSEAVIAEVKRLIPGKPIRYVVNTHVHFDHSGGLRTYVDEGAIVVTQTLNQSFYEKAWAAPRMVEPDRLSRSRKRARFLAVDDHGPIAGRNGRVMEFYRLQGNPHDEEALVVWLPGERILFQSDVIDGAPSNPPEPPSPVAVNFRDNLRRLGLQPAKVVGGHGPILTMAQVYAATGQGN